MIQILLTSQRVSCSRFWTWEVAAGADMPDDPEGLMLLLAPPWFADERKERDTLSRRSNSWTKWTSKSDERKVIPHTGQQDGSSGDFLRPIKRKEGKEKEMIHQLDIIKANIDRHAYLFPTSGSNLSMCVCNSGWSARAALAAGSPLFLGAPSLYQEEDCPSRS